MKSVIDFRRNVDALAFVVLGIAVGIGWARGRDRSLGFLALAIVLLSAVSLLGRLPQLLGFTPPLMSEISLIAFVGCGYALLRYRASLISLPSRWHAVAVVAVAAAGGPFIVSRHLATRKATPAGVEAAAAIAPILVLAAIVIEP